MAETPPGPAYPCAASLLGLAGIACLWHVKTRESMRPQSPSGLPRSCRNRSAKWLKVRQRRRGCREGGLPPVSSRSVSGHGRAVRRSSSSPVDEHPRSGRPPELRVRPMLVMRARFVAKVFVDPGCRTCPSEAVFDNVSPGVDPCQADHKLSVAGSRRTRSRCRALLHPGRSPPPRRGKSMPDRRYPGRDHFRVVRNRSTVAALLGSPRPASEFHLQLLLPHANQLVALQPRPGRADVHLGQKLVVWVRWTCASGGLRRSLSSFRFAGSLVEDLIIAPLRVPQRGQCLMGWTLVAYTRIRTLFGVRQRASLALPTCRLRCGRIPQRTVGTVVNSAQAGARRPSPSSADISGGIRRREPAPSHLETDRFDRQAVACMTRSTS